MRWQLWDSTELFMPLDSEMICFHGDSHHTKKRMCMALLLMTDKYLTALITLFFYYFSKSWRTKEEHQGSVTIIKPQELLSNVQFESLKIVIIQISNDSCAYILESFFFKKHGPSNQILEPEASNLWFDFYNKNNLSKISLLLPWHFLLHTGLEGRISVFWQKIITTSTVRSMTGKWWVCTVQIEQLCQLHRALTQHMLTTNQCPQHPLAPFLNVIISVTLRASLLERLHRLILCPRLLRCTVFLYICLSLSFASHMFNQR